MALVVCFLVCVGACSLGVVYVHLHDDECDRPRGPVESQFTRSVESEGALRFTQCGCAHRVSDLTRHSIPQTNSRSTRYGRNRRRPYANGIGTQLRSQPTTTPHASTGHVTVRTSVSDRLSALSCCPVCRRLISSCPSYSPSCQDSPHLKTEISDAVWRNDQKHQVDVMFHADTADVLRGVTADAARLQRAQWIEGGESTVGLFSRGDESTTATPTRKSFIGKPQQLNRMAITSTVQNSPLTHRAPANPPFSIHPLHSLLSTQLSSTDGPPPLVVHRPPRGVPGQALTHSALDENSSPVVSLPDGIHHAGRPNRQLASTRGGVDQSEPLSMPSTPVASTTREQGVTMSTSTASDRPIFPLPSAPQLLALAPSHFFSWREQVRQHIALLLLQHATRPITTEGATLVASNKSPISAERERSTAVSASSSSSSATPSSTLSPIVVSHASSRDLVVLLRHAAVVSPVPESHDEHSLHTHASVNGMHLHIRGESIISRSTDDDPTGAISPEPPHLTPDHPIDTAAVAKSAGRPLCDARGVESVPLHHGSSTSPTPPHPHDLSSPRSPLLAGACVPSSPACSSRSVSISGVAAESTARSSLASSASPSAHRSRTPQQPLRSTIPPAPRQTTTTTTMMTGLIARPNQAAPPMRSEQTGTQSNDEGPNEDHLH
jgi:hypothetical protein